MHYQKGRSDARLAILATLYYVFMHSKLTMVLALRTGVATRTEWPLKPLLINARGWNTALLSSNYFSL